MQASNAPPWSGFADDPARFAEVVLGLSPTAQQRLFLSAMAGPGARCAVRSGHGTGKSTALAAAALWFLGTRKDALVPCTAPTAHQLHDVLWREMRRLVDGMDGEARELFTVTSDRVLLAGSNGMAVARTARVENPDALQGFHADEILFVIDEAAGVHDRIFDVARGALSTPTARIAMAGNPTRLTGYFHNAFHSAREAWTRLHFSCLDSPLVDAAYPRDIAAEYGGDSDMYRVRVLGDFPVLGLYNLISLELVEQAMSRKPPPDFEIHAPKIIGVDPAWMGTDRSAAVLRQGLFAKVLLTARCLDTVGLAEQVALRAAEVRPDSIFVDQSGVGAGVVDQLKRTSFPVVGISFAQTPADSGRFINKRAEIWWLMKEWLEKKPTIERDQDLRDDLVKPEYHYTPTGKLQLESKADMRRRGLHSPDIGDALALTFSLPVYRRTHAPPVETTENYSAYDWMNRN